MIDPVAKITAPFAPVSACAAASRTTFALRRASSVICGPAVTSIIGISEPALGGPLYSAPLCRDGTDDQPAPAGACHAFAPIGRAGRQRQDQTVGGHREVLAQL